MNNFELLTTQIHPILPKVHFNDEKWTQFLHNLKQSRSTQQSSPPTEHYSIYAGVLHQACMEGRVNVIDALISRGIDVNIYYSHGVTPLMNAARYGHEACVIRLITLGATIGQFDAEGHTALHHAATNDHVPCVRALLRHQSSSPSCDNDQGQALRCACIAGNDNVVRVLLEEGQVHEHARRTALLCAAHKGHDACVQMLLSHGVATICSERHLNFASRYAAGHCDPSTLDMMILHGACVNYQNARGWTPLLYACVTGQIECVRALMTRHGARVDDTLKSHSGCLHLSGGMDHIDVFQYMIEQKADVDAVDGRGVCVLSLLTGAPFQQ